MDMLYSNDYLIILVDNLRMNSVLFTFSERRYSTELDFIKYIFIYNYIYDSMFPIKPIDKRNCL
jgi:hypothetical protein